MFDLESARIFVCVVEAGGFNAAAEVIHKTQPAISAAVKKLEDVLGVTLFDRAHYRPVLTAVGEKFFQRLKPLLGHWQDVDAFVGLLKAKVESDFTIAIDMFFPFEKLQTLFKHWLNLYPHTHFHFLFESLGGACERLVARQADLVITEDLITNQAIEVHVLHSEAMIAVASPDFIEVHQTQLSSLDTLNACMQVILRDSSKSDFSFGVVSHCRHWTVRDVRAKKEIILAGLGWGRLPLFLIQSELDSGLLVRLQGHHFDTRLLTFSAIRLQKSNYGTIATQIWEDLGANIESLKSGS